MMKRLMIIFLGALAIFMAGCTGDVIAPVPERLPEGDQAWVTDLSLPVPIELGVSTHTRSMVNRLEDMDGGRFGIFAIDRDSETLNSLLFNEVAYYNHSLGHFRFGSKENQKVIYYPRDSKVNYSFYAFYKRGEYIPVVETEESRILMDVELFKSNDVLWGKAESGAAYGYNEMYFRKNPTEDVVFNFSHPAACISFSVSPSENLALPATATFIVARLIFKNVATKAKLCVVDCSSEGSDEGHFCGVSEVTEVVTMRTLNSEGKETANLETNLTVDSQPDQHLVIGRDIFIAPQTETIQCELEVTNKGNGNYVIPFDLHPSVVNSALSGFEAGKRYGFNLVIGRKGPRPIIERIEASSASR